MRMRNGFFLIGLAAACFVACSTNSSSNAGGANGGGGGNGSGGTDSDGGASATDGSSGGDDSGNSITPSSATSVLMRHKNASRDGAYIDPLITKAAARNIHRDTGFTAQIQGPVYAEPLYVEKGVNNKPTLYVATEQDIVYALDAVTGAILWQKTVGKPVPQRFFECSNIDPVGITGTPAIDLSSRMIFFDSITTPDDGTTKKHMVHALRLDDGSEQHGYPIDLESKVTLEGGMKFDSAYFQQRGAVLLLKNGVYIPFGGYAGDCGVYKGTVLGFQMENPGEVHAWSIGGKGGGIWGTGGIATDGSVMYVATGNQDAPDTYQYGNSVVKLGVGPTFSKQPTDWFTPSNRVELDAQDLELGGTAPVLFDLPGANPSKLLIAFGKNGNAYVLDRTNLGGTGKGDGIKGEGLASDKVATNYIINSPAVYRTAQGTYAVFKGAGVGCPTGTSLTSLKINANPIGISKAWCVDHHGEGSPVVTTTDGKNDAIVWVVGAEGSTKLHGFDGDTGEEIFTGGDETYPFIARFQSPIIANGRIYWATQESVIAYTVK